MTFSNCNPLSGRCLRFVGALSLSAAALLVSAGAYAQPDAEYTLPAQPEQTHNLVYIIPGEPQISTLYYDGSQIVVETDTRWKFMDGSNTHGLTLEDLKWYADNHMAALENDPVLIIDNGTRGDGLDILYVDVDGSVPADALPAFSMAETYLENLFADDIQVICTCKFESMSGGVLGSCAAGYRRNEGWINSRNGLQSGMDSDDVIQSYLPTGDTIPVRYNGSSTTVTQEGHIDWTKANYRATIGTIDGTAASMTYNSNVNWDWNPANGVPSNKMSFVDVVCHETGHAFGFVSAVDGAGGSMEALDIFRFQRTDSGFDYNPDTYAEFQTTPRLVDYNNPNDSHNSDLIDYEYRMADGYPYQASHFREQADWIGLMDPAMANGETHYPDYYSSADKNMFDAIGYDYPPCDVVFTSQPEPSQTVCEGDTVSLSVTVEDPFIMEFQWRKGATDLVDDGSHIFGATTDTLMIVGVTEADEASDYNCVVTNTVDECSLTSNLAEILVEPLPVITDQPDDLTVTEGDLAWFSVTVEDAFLMDFQWRKDGSPLSDGGPISGATTSTLFIAPVEESDEGEYDCVVTSQVPPYCSTTSEAATLTVNPSGGCPNPGASGYYCTADIDGSGDCIVDLSDLGVMLAAYGTCPGDPAYNPDANLDDGNPCINLSDLGVMLTQYGDNCN